MHIASSIAFFYNVIWIGLEKTMEVKSMCFHNMVSSSRILTLDLHFHLMYNTLWTTVNANVYSFQSESKKIKLHEKTW